MREIKFRQYLWNDDSKTTGGRMIDWEELLQEAEESLASNFTSKFSNASELMQYTGLKDKNGKEIYEGDIIEITGNYKPGRYVVIWDDYRVAWWGKNIKVRDREYDDDFFQLLGSWQKDITEVIGNVHEKFGQLNLLEVKE